MSTYLVVSDKIYGVADAPDLPALYRSRIEAFGCVELARKNRVNCNVIVFPAKDTDKDGLLHIVLNEGAYGRVGLGMFDERSYFTFKNNAEDYAKFVASINAISRTPRVFSLPLKDM